MRTVVGRRPDGGTVHVAWTERIDGDLGVDAPGVEARRAAVVDRPWIWMRQVHGAHVVSVEAGDASRWCGIEADALVTRREDVALAVQSADCVAIGLWSDDGVVAVAHCGWRGLVAGVIDATVDVVRCSTTGPLHAVLGPSIGPECYEFGTDELDRVRDVIGDDVVARTKDGRPSLDVRSGVRRELERLGVAIDALDDRCTACAVDVLHSHRARGERARHALVVWIGS